MTDSPGHPHSDTRAPASESTVATPLGFPFTSSVQGAAGRLLVFVHGWCCNPGFWREQADFFAQNHRVALIDLNEQHDGIGPSAITGFAKRVVALTEDLGGGPAILIGHSMGGPVVIEAAIELAERCTLVIGVDSFTDAAFYRRLAPLEKERRLDGFRSDFQRRMSSMVRAITSDRIDGLADWIASVMAESDQAVAIETLGSLLEWDIEERWPHLVCPVETINSATLSAGGEPIDLPGLTVHLMDDVGHFPMLEDPQRFNALMKSVIDQHQL